MSFLLAAFLSSFPPRNGKIGQVLEFAKSSESENGAINFQHQVQTDIQGLGPSDRQIVGTR
jgi:hypothetical protein